jgi:hypothetical protein
MVDDARPLIAPGMVTATPAALAALEAVGEHPTTYVRRHLAGDWGTHGNYTETVVTDRERQYGAMATDDDAKLNRLAVDQDDGSRVMSRYELADGTALLVCTQGEGRHRSTCVMLPADY